MDIRARSTPAKRLCLSATVCLLLAPTAALAARTPGNAAAGRTVFLANNCGSCHTLQAAAASSPVSSNLDKKKASYATIVRVVTNGATKSGLAMPAYRGTLTTKQIQNLATFVYSSTHK
jgi:mono/diheme cytochrome c family protein